MFDFVMTPFAPKEVATVVGVSEQIVQRARSARSIEANCLPFGRSSYDLSHHNFFDILSFSLRRRYMISHFTTEESWDLAFEFVDKLANALEANCEAWSSQATDDWIFRTAMEINKCPGEFCFNDVLCKYDSDQSARSISEEDEDIIENCIETLRLFNRACNFLKTEQCSHVASMHESRLYRAESRTNNENSPRVSGRLDRTE